MVELNDKIPWLHHNANGDLASSLRAVTFNGDKSHTSSSRPDIFNGDTMKAKSHNFHEDNIWPVLCCKLPCLGILPFKRRFVVVSSFLVLLILTFLFFLMVALYPAFMHPSLVRHKEALSFPLLNFFHRKQLNETLLAHAKVDLGEEWDRRQAKNILDGTESRTSIYSYTQEGHYRDRLHDRHAGSEALRLPLQLSSVRYRPFWTQFHNALRAWVQKKHYDPQIMAQLLSIVKGPVDHHFTTSNQTVTPGKPYKTCAVIGNSGILLNQNHGSLIDGHDMVMRLNNARVIGFEKHVGSKTTLSFINSNILHSCARRSGCFCHPYGTNVPLILYICQVVHLMDVEICSSSLQAPVIVTDPRFDTLCARIVKYYSLRRFVEATGRRLEDWSNTHEGPMFHYSSGMQAILLAVGICENVSIFGFGKSDSSKHHYHTGQRAELGLHDYEAEYEFYRDLVLQNAEIIPFLSEAGFSLPSVHLYQ